MKVTAKPLNSNSHNLKMSQRPPNNIPTPQRLPREPPKLQTKRHLRLSWGHNNSNTSLSSSNSTFTSNPIRTSLQRANPINSSSTTKLDRTTRISKVTLGREAPTNPTLRKMTTPNSSNSSTSLLAADHPPKYPCKLTHRPLHHHSRQEPPLQPRPTRLDLMHHHSSLSTREAKVMRLWTHKTTGASSRPTGTSLGNSLSMQRASMIISSQQTSILNSRCWKINSIAILTRTSKNVLPKYKRTLKDTWRRDNMSSQSSKLWLTRPFLGAHPSSRSSDHWWPVLRSRLVIWISRSQG